MQQMNEWINKLNIILLLRSLSLLSGIEPTLSNTELVFPFHYNGDNFRNYTFII